MSCKKGAVYSSTSLDGLSEILPPLVCTGCFTDSLKAKARARHRLEPGAIRVPGLGSRKQPVGWRRQADRRKNVLLRASLSYFFYSERTIIKGAAKNKHIFPRPCFVMACWIPEDKKIRTTNQVEFSEHEFPFRKRYLRKMVEQFLSDNSNDICTFQCQMDTLQ